MCRTFQQQNIQKHVLPIKLLTVENALSINNFKLNRRNQRFIQDFLTLINSTLAGIGNIFELLCQVREESRIKEKQCFQRRVISIRDAGKRENGGGIAPLSLQKGFKGGSKEVPFHNNIIGNFMVNQYRIEKNLQHPKIWKGFL